MKKIAEVKELLGLESVCLITVCTVNMWNNYGHLEKISR